MACEEGPSNLTPQSRALLISLCKAATVDCESPLRENSGGSSINVTNFLTLLSNFPYVGGESGIQKSRKLPHVVNERPPTKNFVCFFISFL